LVLILLFALWHPMPQIVWQITDPQIAAAVMALSFAGWLLVLVSTFLINHFELFGLHQVAINLAGRTMPAPRFKTPVLYKVVRHPIYLGFIVAFWAAPVMTVGHLLFAAVTTALERRSLVAPSATLWRVPWMDKSYDNTARGTDHWRHWPRWRLSFRVFAHERIRRSWRKTAVFLL